ncbi:MAG: hypothetical protein Q8N77_01025 [Nanoarchaeota archaeon]|nr:hypothetical protein [Nanoarchaeota archaeon]
MNNSKELRKLEKELQALEVDFLKAVEGKDVKDLDIWRKYQDTRIKYVKTLENE